MTTISPRFALRLGVAAALLTSLAFSAAAQGDGDRATRCASWIAKKGYSRDYVEQRTGFRPPPRNRWQDNIRLEELQVGDVVGVTLWPGHVALVEEIARDQDAKPTRLRVSSFNYGHGQGWLDRSCEATVKFGIETASWVSIAETTGYWRPGLTGSK